MKKGDLICIGVIVLIMIIAVVYSFTGKDTTTINEETATCISERSEIYVLSTCGACKAQKEILGEYLELFNITDCTENPELCVGISAVPTWFINGEKVVGVRTVEQLKEISGC